MSSRGRPGAGWARSDDAPIVAGRRPRVNRRAGWSACDRSDRRATLRGCAGVQPIRVGNRRRSKWRGPLGAPMKDWRCESRPDLDAENRGSGPLASKPGLRAARPTAAWVRIRDARGSDACSSVRQKGRCRPGNAERRRPRRLRDRPDGPIFSEIPIGRFTDPKLKSERGPVLPSVRRGKPGWMPRGKKPLAWSGGVVKFVPVRPAGSVAGLSSLRSIGLRPEGAKPRCQS